ncbi:MAG: hypothetical protein ACRC1M_05135 [Methanobacteriaceae archaeon]
MEKITKMMKPVLWPNCRNNSSKLLKDGRGSIFSLDLLFSMIVLVIIIATVSYSLNILIESNNNNYEDSNLEKIAQDTVNNLIKTPGTPDNWETLFSYSNSPIKVGLVNSNIYNVNNTFRRDDSKDTISLAKINKLKNNYNTLIDKGQLYGLIKSSMKIYPVNSELSPINIKDEGLDSLTSRNIININRTVNIDYLSDYVLLKFQNNDHSNMDNNSRNKNNYLGEKGNYGTGFCNHQTINDSNHTNINDERWICKTFTIERMDIDKYKYYLFFNKNTIYSNSYWILDDNSDVNNSDKDKKDKNSINTEYKDISKEIVEKVEGNSEKTFWLHLQYPNSGLNGINNDKNNDNENYETYLVAIPNDMSVNDLTIENFKIQPAYFVAKFWR